MAPRPGGSASQHGSTRPQTVRPRYGRIGVVAGALAVTAVAVLGAVGILPATNDTATSGASGMPTAGAVNDVGVPGPAGVDVGVPPQAAIALSAFDLPERDQLLPAAAEAAAEQAAGSEVLPARSGSGKRVVFDISEQRVWLVGPADRVRRTYLVSGSVTRNLRPGRYAVYSTSRRAVGIDGSGTMQYMVRFAHGRRAAIGFHDIPVDQGRLVQSRAQLGTPQSHGCIRQWRHDARALWYFAIVGTPVVVTA